MTEAVNEGRSIVQLASAIDPQVKTELAVALGVHLARSNRRVLLVDADFRAGTIAELFGLADKKGLCDFLASDGRDRQAITPANAMATPDGGSLDVICAGSEQARSSGPDLLASPALAQCLKNWRKKYELVLVDGPPVLGLADAGILSHQVDQTLLVVLHGRCQLADVREALMHLRPSSDGCVPIVFVGVGRSTKES